MIGAEPMIEDFDDFNLTSVQTEFSRPGQAMSFVGLDLDTHAFVSLKMTDGLRALLWARAEGTRWKLICCRFGIARATAHRRWHYALSLIAYRLNGRRVPAKRSHRFSAVMATGSDGRASLDAIGGEADGLRTCAIRREW